MPSHHHRAGSLRQSNKRNKRSKSSKRSVSRATGGRVNVKRSAASLASTSTKADRRHAQKQKRDASRLAVLQKKRGIASSSHHVPPPRLVGIISLGQEQEDDDTMEVRLQKMLTKCADQTYVTNHGITAKYNVHKNEGNVTFLTSCTRTFAGRPQLYGNDAAVMRALDLCRVCDMILFVIDGNGPNDADNDPLGMSIGGGDHQSTTTKNTMNPQDWHHLISERGDTILAAVKGQGLPTPVTILARTAKDDEPDEDYMTVKSSKSVRRSAMKKHADLKRYVSRFATTEFGSGNDKVLEVDLTLEASDTMLDKDEDKKEHDDVEYRQKQASVDAVVRSLCTMAATPPKWVAEAPRSYVLADSSSYNTENQELLLTGYIRGKVPFNVNSLIHVPNVGTFACKSVQKATPPFFKEKEVMEEEETTMLLSDPMKREPLEMFATPDALEGEQNLVGFDEDMHDDDDEYENDSEDEAVERPAGWSDYQSAWLDAVDDGIADELDHGELAKELNRKPSDAASIATTGGRAMELDDEDVQVSAVEKMALVAQRRKDQKEEREFPDEVEVDENVNARDRYARYRSLKSFRQSHWDPKENLPDSYGSIYHFPSFKSTQRDVFSDLEKVAAATNAVGDFWGGVHNPNVEMEDDNDGGVSDFLDGCVPSGSYVTITLQGVATMTNSSEAAIMVAVSLLSHENKASVLHMGLCQSAKCDQSEENDPVKSKDVLTFRCGWRTWTGRPVFSQNNLNSDKHKFERFLPPGGAFFAASVFGPVTYTPCPVLVFRNRAPPLVAETHSFASRRDLVAIGSIYGADADRIVVKRVILTGYPTRVHKRHATIKYMFYNPDDVRWFKPAGLVTKHGLHGHIVQSVGEHGTMKCLFNAPIKQHDTVCLPLYKRIFPKFAPASSTVVSDDGEAAPVHAAAKKTDLVVL